MTKWLHHQWGWHPFPPVVVAVFQNLNQPLATLSRGGETNRYIKIDSWGCHPFACWLSDCKRSRTRRQQIPREEDFSISLVRMNQNGFLRHHRTREAQKRNSRTVSGTTPPQVSGLRLHPPTPKRAYVSHGKGPPSLQKVHIRIH